MNDQPPPASIPAAHPSPADRVRQLALELQRRRRAGEVLSDEKFLQAYPDIRDELSRELRKLRVIGAACDQVEQGGFLSPNDGLTTAPGPANVLCPACRTPQQIDFDQGSGEKSATCHACGDTFRVTPTRWTPPLADRTIDRFQLLEHVGTGGFGTVWRARDTRLDRIVAVKIPRNQHLTEEEADQFLREARTSAQLHHPHIVPVHEVGHDGHMIYLVSSFIDGEPLSIYQLQHPLTARSAAALCVKIAQALAYAHSIGVVHRDIKPQNILIDRSGEPFVSDFGLARRAEVDVTVTVDGAILGTPTYMSPEQARGESHTSDGRSDVYSLGVVLFEMLTSVPPFRGSAANVMRQVIEDEPPVPRRLNSTIPRDLETICLKCLEKNPAARYQTPHELAEDLQKWLDNRTIAARRVGPFGRALRWAGRKPALATALALLVAVTVLGFAGITWQATRAMRSEKTAKRSAERSARALGFLVTSFRSPDPVNDGRDVKMIDVLERLINKADSELDQDPVQKAAVLVAIGESLRSLGIYDRAIQVHETALAINQRELGQLHLDTLWSMSRLAESYHAVGEWEKSLPLLEQAWKGFRGDPEADIHRSLIVMRGLASAYLDRGKAQKSRELAEQNLKLSIEAFGEGHLHSLYALNLLGLVYVELQMPARALPLQQRALDLAQLKLGPYAATTLEALNHLAVTYSSLEQWEQALPLNQQSLEGKTRLYGKTHAATLVARYNLATVYLRLGQLDEALPIMDESVTIAQQELGEDHPHTIQFMSGQAQALRLARDLDRSIPLAESVHELARRKFGESHLITIIAMRQLGEQYRVNEEPRRALQWFQDAYELAVDALGPQNPTTLAAMRSRAGVELMLTGDPAHLGTLQENLRLERQRLGADVIRLATILQNVAEKMLWAEEHAAAEPILRECLRIRQDKQPNEWRVFEAKSCLGDALAGQAAYDEAESLLLEGYRGMQEHAQKISRPLPKHITEARQRLIDFYTHTDRPDKAAKWRNSLDS